MNGHFSKEMTDDHMKRCSASLFISKCKSKPQWSTTLQLLGWLHSKSQTTSVGEDVEELEPSGTAGGNVKWHNCCGEQFDSSLKVKQSYHIIKQFLSKHIYPREMEVYVHTKSYIQIFIPAPFIIAKRWKQPKCSSTDKWINKMWYVHTIGYYLAINQVLIHTRNSKTLFKVKESSHKRNILCNSVHMKVFGTGKSTETEVY